jgi:polysaccharide export outer membrane protein
MFSGRLSILVAVTFAAPVAWSQQPSSPEPAAQVSDNSYAIGPGDVLNIFVWREPDLTVTVPVRPDGRISTPLVEDMVAVGKTPSQLARDIEGILLKDYVDPKVTVIVESFVGTFDTQVRVLGEVANAGTFAFRNGMTLLDALVEAGGLTDFASRKAVLSRTVNGIRQEFGIRIKKLMEDGDLRENMPLRPGDVIVVRQASW